MRGAWFEKGLAQASRVTALEREAARLDGEIGRLNADIGRIESDQAELQVQRLSLFSQRRLEALAQLREIEPKILDLLEQRDNVDDRLNRTVVKAPMSGIIFGLTVFAEQSVISPAEPLMYIVPKDQDLVVSAKVEAVHIDQVFVGQEANLKFTSFDQRFTQDLLAEVHTISADVIVDEQTEFTVLRSSIDNQRG